MEQSLTELFSLSFIVLCLVVAGVTEVLRRITDFVLDNPNIPASKNSKIWTQLILPTSPLGIGIAITLLFPSLPYPDGWHTKDARLLLGFVAGLLSTLVFRIAKSFLKEKIDNYKKSRSIPPPPCPPGTHGSSE